MACLKFWCTGLSAADTKRVPIWMPSAPAAKAAAMPMPSLMPPAATMGNIAMPADALQQRQQAHRVRVLEAAAFGALDDQAVHAAFHGLHGALQGGHRVVHGYAGILEHVDELGGVARGGGDELHAVLHHEAHHAVVAQEQQRQVDAEGLVGKLGHGADFALAVFGFAGGGFDDAEAAGVADGGGQL